MFINDEDFFTTNLKEAENIPPLVFNILGKLGPAIKCLALFTDVLIWKDPSTSLFFVFLWITLCTSTQRWLVFGLPCLYLVKLVRDWFGVQMLRKRRETAEQRAKRESIINQDLDISRGIQPASPISLSDTLEHLQQIQAWWSCHCHWKHAFSYANDQHAILLIYIWPIWAMLNFVLGSHGIFALGGVWLLVSCSPWYQVISFALRNNTILRHYIRAFMDYNIASFVCLFYPAAKKQHSCVKTLLMSPPPTPSTSISSLKSHLGYQCEIALIFQVYENQRWWLGLGWTESLLQNEREPWTDNQLKPIISTYEYKLPKEKRSIFHDKDNVEKITVKNWLWTDRDWWVDMTGELDGRIDKNGWQYGDNRWQDLMPTPGPNSFTRQRKWCRRVKLIEKQWIVE
ncbi:hypothetical protein [Parasitella parasitica]|uniref:TECPR1-like DysF domain-containing protein n=1 Tax=Parasitella parasitica TaxID=35722 RepID=A0A0B7MWG6_9FUNG|nr:hypothetical protein [Parasitella parasitica]